MAEEVEARKVSISLPSNLVDRIEDFAEDKNLKRSQVIRKGMEQFFEEAGEPDLWENETSEKLKQIDAKQDTILRTLEKGVSEFLGKSKKEEEKESKIEVDEWDDTLDWGGEEEKGKAEKDEWDETSDWEEEEEDSNPILAKSVRKVSELLGKAKKKTKEYAIREMVDLLEGEGYEVTKA